MTTMTSAGLHLALRRVGSITEPPVFSPGSIRYCLTDCAEWIHQDNRQRGWWNDLHTGHPLTRNVGELLMLMVSELAEVPSLGAHTKMDDKLPERLMFEVELADCAIRIFDTAGALAPEFKEGYLVGCELGPNYKLLSVDDHLMWTVRMLSLAMEHHRKKMMNANSIPGFDYYLGRALHSVFYTGKAFQLNVADAMVEKLEYNRQRADHQPENRKAVGGKTY